MQAFVSDVTELRSKFKNAVFILGGDFNLPDIKWPDREIIGHAYNLQTSQCIMDMADNLSRNSARVKRTRSISFSPHMQRLWLKCKPIPPLGKSDHDSVLIDPNRTKPVKRKITIWARADHDSIRNDLEQFQSDL